MKYLPCFTWQYNMYYQQEMLKKSLLLVKKDILRGRKDELFYNYLISKARNKEEKNIITSMRNDKKTQKEMLKKLYKDFTGENIYCEDVKEFKKPSSYIDGVKEALGAELNSIETHTEMMQCIPFIQYRDMLFDIIKDEIKHGMNYNYILYTNSNKSKNKTNNKIEKVGSSISKIGKDAVGKVRKRLNEENILKEVVIPGIVLGIKNAYLEDNDNQKRTINNMTLKEESQRYIASVVELAFEQIQKKVDLEELFQQYIMPQLLENE